MNQMQMGANLAIAVGGLAVCLLGLLQALRGAHLEATTRKYLVAIFLVLVVYVSFDLLSQILDDFTGSAWAMVQRIELLTESILPSVVELLLTAFMLHASGDDDWRHSTAFRANAVLLASYVAMNLWTLVFGTFYYITESNAYQRGPLYPVLLVPTLLIMLVNAYVLWSCRARLTSRQRRAFAAYLALPVVGMVWQMLAYGLYTVVLGTSIGALVMFSYTLSDATERYWQQERELERMRSDIVLSQIKPHFLCNTLGAIGRLCKDDPEAREAILTFSRYLRDNVDVLDGISAVSFDRELEHTKTYLELEQLRFGDELSVAYNIECTDFTIPTFTLQPLAENAVRHGIRGTEEGTGTVTISSRDCGDHWEVSVADDGAGFDPSASPSYDGRHHVGLANVSERLRGSYGGTLCIDSAPGYGTVATVVLPKNGRRS